MTAEIAVNGRPQFAMMRRPRVRVLMTHDYPPITGGGLALAVRDLARALPCARSARS